MRVDVIDIRMGWTWPMSNAEERCIALSKEIQNKESKVGLNGLNDSEKQFYLVDSLLMQLNNGGFDQHFTNSTGQYWNETVSVLERLDLQLLSLGKRQKLFTTVMKTKTTNSTS